MLVCYAMCVVIKYMHIYFISIIKEKRTNKKREETLRGECQPPVWASTWPRVATSGKQKANTYKPPLRGRVILQEIKHRHLVKDDTEGK